MKQAKKFTLDEVFEALSKREKNIPKGKVHPLLVGMGYSNELEGEE